MGMKYEYISLLLNNKFPIPTQPISLPPSKLLVGPPMRNALAPPPLPPPVTWATAATPAMRPALILSGGGGGGFAGRHIIF